MKKVGIALVVLLVGGVALLLGLKQGGVSLGGFGFAWNEDKAVLRELAHSFLEDLQYKDFKKAASYHTHADQAKVEIPKLIERLFQVKPEQLNIRDIEITQVTIDSSGDRARTFFRSTIELLNSSRKKDQPNEERKVEGILYWHERPASEALPPPPKPGETAKEPEVVGYAGGDQSERRWRDIDGGTPHERAGAAAGAEPEKRWFMMLESSLH